MGRFQPRRGGIQSTFAAARPAIVSTPADDALSARQLAAYDASNKLVADVSLGDESKNEAAQLQLLAVAVFFTADSLPGGTTPDGWVNQIDWQSTLTARKAALASSK